MNATTTTVPEDDKYKETFVVLDSIKIESESKTPAEYMQHVNELTRSIYLNGKTKEYLLENISTVFGYNVSEQDIVVKIEGEYIRSYNKQINGISRVLFINDYVSANANELALMLHSIDLFSSAYTNSWIQNVILNKAKDLLYELNKKS